jgi:tetratricopeptide (TPR) repeat protein
VDLVTAYDNIGFVYDKIGNQSEALMYFEKSLNIRLKVLPSDDSSLIGSYSNIGLMLSDMAENVKALS